MIELVAPFPQYGLERAWSWVDQCRTTFVDDFFPSTYQDFCEYWRAKERGGRRSWGVMRDGLLGGVITSERVSPTVADFHCLFARDFWGRDTVVPALGQACDEIFRDPAIDKLSTVAFARNMSLAGMMRHFGVTREGLLHGHTRQGGKLVDLQMLGLERSRFYVVWDQQRRNGHDHVGHKRVGEANLQPVHPVEQHVDVERDTGDQRNDVGRIDGRANADAGAGTVPDASAVGAAPQATVGRP